MDKRAIGGAIVKLVAWSLVLLILVGLFALMLLGNTIDFINIGNISFFSSYVYDDPETYNVGDMEYDDMVYSLDISWMAGTVDIVVSDGDSVKLVESGADDDDEALMRSKVEGGRLIVKFADSGISIFGNNRQPKKLTVYIPASMCRSLQTLAVDGASSVLTVDGGYGDKSESIFCFDKIDVDTASGVVNIKCKSATEVDIDTASGDVTLEGSFGEVEIDAASADVKLYGSAESIELDAASGKICVDGEIVSADFGAVSGDVKITTHNTLPKILKVETVSGKIDLTLPDIESGFQAKHEGASGKMICDGIKTNYYKHGEGKAIYEFETASGDVVINIK